MSRGHCLVRMDLLPDTEGQLALNPALVHSPWFKNTGAAPLARSTDCVTAASAAIESRITCCVSRISRGLVIA